MTSKLGFVLIATALFVLAGANARIASAAPATTACSLLSLEQVSSVLGVKVPAGKPFMDKLCTWPAGAEKRVTLNLISPQAFAYAKMPIGNAAVKTEVKGIGDDAVYVTTHGAPTTLTVKKGNAAFTVVVFGFSDDLTKAKEKTLALEICSKL